MPSECRRRHFLPPGRFSATRREAARQGALEGLFGQVDELRTTLRIEGQKEGELTVLSFHGRDTISGLASYDLTVGSSAETAAKLDDALGREVVFVVERVEDDTSLHVMRGIVEEIFPGGVAVGKNVRRSQNRGASASPSSVTRKAHACSQKLTMVEIVKH